MGLDAKGNPIEINSGNVCNYCRERSVVHYKDMRIKKFVQGSYKLQTTYSTAARAASYQRRADIHTAHVCASLSSRGNSPLSPASCHCPGPELHLSKCDCSAFSSKPSQSLTLRGIGENCSVLRSLIHAERLKFKTKYL